MASIEYAALLGSEGALGAGDVVRLRLSTHEDLPRLLENPTSTEEIEVTGTWYLEGQDDERRLAFYRRVSSSALLDED